MVADSALAQLRGEKYCLDRALRVSPFGLLFHQATEQLPNRLVQASASPEAELAIASLAWASCPCLNNSHMRLNL